MNYKRLIISIIMLMFTTSCSLLEKAVYHPEINQGNYLTSADIAKIHTGMTKQQVIYILGTSMLKDPFDSNTWYYICYRDLDQELITPQTLIFNKSDILTYIGDKLIFNCINSRQ